MCRMGAVALTITRSHRRLAGWPHAKMTQSSRGIEPNPRQKVALLCKAGSHEEESKPFQGLTRLHPMPYTRPTSSGGMVIRELRAACTQHEAALDVRLLVSMSRRRRQLWPPNRNAAAALYPAYLTSSFKQAGGIPAKTWRSPPPPRPPGTGCLAAAWWLWSQPAPAAPLQPALQQVGGADIHLHVVPIGGSSATVASPIFPS